MQTYTLVKKKQSCRRSFSFKYNSKKKYLLQGHTSPVGGKVYNGFLFVSQSQFINIISEASKPEVSSINLTKKQVKLLIK